MDYIKLFTVDAFNQTIRGDRYSDKLQYVEIKLIANYGSNNKTLIDNYFNKKAVHFFHNDFFREDRY